MANEAVNVNLRIRLYIIKHFPLASKKSIIQDDSPLFDSGIIDSLGILDLICFIEKEFRIKISDEDMRPENFESIACMATFVQSKANGQLTI